jgi:glycosyltransferase involved in cell wall biosynthesis
MRFCFVNMPIEFYSPVSGGAIATVIMQMARELGGFGHEVTVLTTLDGNRPYPEGKIVRIENRNGTELNAAQRFVSRVRGKIKKFDWPCFDYYLRSFLQALRGLRPAPDVVVLFNDLVSPEYVKGILPGAKVIVWQHNEWGTRHDMRRTIAATDVFVANSGYIRDWTIKKHGIPESKFVVAHNGVDVEAFHPRENYLERRDPVRVLFIGRIDPNKGPDIAADAVAALVGEGLPVTLTVAGGLWFYGDVDPMTDPYFRKLKVKMEAANANYLGHVDRNAVPELVREHDVVCVLSRSNEPFGLVVLEGMASGCAVIASKRGGLPEACGEAALLVDEKDLSAVTGALRSLVTDGGLLQEQKERSVARAGRQTWTECARIMEGAALERGAALAGSAA